MDSSIKYDRIFLEPRCFLYTFQFDSAQVKVKSKQELSFFNNHFERDECISGGKNNNKTIALIVTLNTAMLSLIPQQNASLLK